MPDERENAIDAPRRVSWLVERIFNIKLVWARFRRKHLPYLVYWGDELDVLVTLSQDRLTETSMEGAFRQFNSGAFVDAEKVFSEMGIGFDKGLGPDGRDWNWDWSLDGPISVTFRGRAKHPEKRLERPRPKLATKDGVKL